MRSKIGSQEDLVESTYAMRSAKNTLNMYSYVQKTNSHLYASVVLKFRDSSLQMCQ